MSQRARLNIKLVLKVLGFLLIIESFFMLLGIPFSIYYKEDDILALLLSSIITALSGGILYFSYGIKKDKQKRDHINKKEGYLLVGTAWIAISIFGTLPFLLSGSITNFTDAFFETISGFTTTGASILNDIEAVPKGVLFWRSMTHWIGGMGIIVLSIAILPMLGFGGLQLFAAEAPGPTPDKIHPKIARTAKTLWSIYILLTLLETVLLMFGNMSFFDALCHSFGTMATGGFSTKNASIIGMSPYIQYVIIVFMFLAGMNFTLHFFAIKLRFKKIFACQEFKTYLGIILVATAIITAFFVGNSQYDSNSIRNILFQVVSITTTTGFVSDNYLNWPGSIWIIIVILMFTGGCAGSTGGGIKISRLIILYKNSTAELKRLLHPSAIVAIRFNKKTVSRSLILNVLAFFLLYMTIFAGGSAFMTLLGLDFESAIGSVAATLGNIGPAIGNVGPIDNYSQIPSVGKWFLSFLMLLGRLELFTILILFSRTYWKR